MKMKKWNNASRLTLYENAVGTFCVQIDSSGKCEIRTCLIWLNIKTCVVRYYVHRLQFTFQNIKIESVDASVFFTHFACSFSFLVDAYLLRPVISVLSNNNNNKRRRHPVKDHHNDRFTMCYSRYSKKEKELECEKEPVENETFDLQFETWINDTQFEMSMQ